MKINIILFGEPFRDGGQGSRVRDVEKSRQEQKMACDSHCALAEKLESDGYEVEFHIESYATKYEAELCSWYGSKMKSSNFRSNLVGIERLVSEGISKVCFSGKNHQTCIFVCRIDLVLKPAFMKIFDPTWRRLMFSSACWIIGNGHVFSGRPRVSDMMMFVPSNLVEKVEKRTFFSHEAWAAYMDHGILGEQELGLMLNTYHDSDSAKDYNPLYWIANRRKSNWWHSVGYVVGKNMMPEMTGERHEFDDWTHKDVLPDSKKENFPKDTWEWWHQDKEHLPKFYSFMNFIKDEVYGQIIDHHHPDQSYWDLRDGQMLIIDDKKRVCSYMEKKHDGVYVGSYEFNKDITFMIVKVKL